MELDGLSIGRSEVIQMFRLEDKLRKSDYYQDFYDKHQDGRGAVEDVIQRQVLRDSGYKETDENLAQYRSIPNRFRDDKEVVNSVMFMKYNIMKDTPIRMGDELKDVELNKLTGEPCLLTSFMTENRPLVVLAGSRT